MIFCRIQKLAFEKFATLFLLFGLALSSSTFATYAQFVPSTSTSSTEKAKVTLPDPLTPEAARGLVSELSDQQVRSLLLERLDAVAKKELALKSANEAGFAALLESWVVTIGGNFATAVTRIPRIWEGLKTSTSNFANTHGTTGILKLIGILIAAIGAGLIAEYIVNYLVRGRRENVKGIGEGQSLGQTLKILGSRLFWDLIALWVFFAVTRLIASNLIPEAMAPVVQLFMIQMIVIPRYGIVFSRFLVAPNNPKLRLINATDETARFFHRVTIAGAILIGFSTFIIQFHALNGVQMGETRLSYWLSGALFALVIIAFVKTRVATIQVLVGSKPEEVTPAEMRFAQVYPLMAIVLTFLIWCVVEILSGMGRFDLLGGRQYIVLALIIFAPAFDTAIRGLVRHLVPPMQGEGIVAQAAHISTKRSYIRIGRTILFAIVVIIIAGLWDIDFENMASMGVGAQFAGRFLEMLIIIATGYLVWEVITLLLNRKLAAEQTADGFDLSADEPGGGEGGGQGGSRLSTVLPMVRFTLQTVIATMTLLIALGNIGVDTTPLLAGAGIVGLAVGFGAQALVKDVVAGIFFLVDDAFRVGEYLVIGTTVGTVEKISLRSLQLRHHQGPVHTIPFGEMKQVTNNSRDWVIVKIKFTVPFGTDTHKIKKLFKVIGAEMKQSAYADDLIQTFKSQGVYDVDDVGIVIRGKFMAKPGTQWIIRKDVFTRVQKCFEENGIDFARKEVRVQIPGLDENTELSDEQKKTVAAAANEAAEKAEPSVA